MRPAPTGADLVTWLGDDEADATRAEAVVQIVTASASAYTRGQGFVDNTVTEGLWAVIVVAAGRAFDNPAGDSQGTDTGGPYTVQRVGTPFTSWTPLELAVLNDLRVRTNRPKVI